jgi:phosphotransacetylase
MSRKEQILFCINIALESIFKMNDLFMLVDDKDKMHIEFQLELQFDMIFDLSKLETTYTISDLVDKIDLMIPEQY